MFMMIHGLVTQTDQSIDDNVENDSFVMVGGANDANNSTVKTSLKTSQKITKKKKREITANQFDFIWNKKILGNLETRD